MVRESLVLLATSPAHWHRSVDGDAVGSSSGDLSRSRGVADKNIPSAMVFFHIITEKYQGYLTKNLQQ
jgi:hypothetical protein